MKFTFAAVSAAMAASYQHGLDTYDYNVAMKADPKQMQVIKPAELNGIVAKAMSTGVVVYETTKQFVLDACTINGYNIPSEIWGFISGIADCVMSVIDRGFGVIMDALKAFLTNYPKFAAFLCLDTYVKTIVSKTTAQSSNSNTATTVATIL